MNEHDIIEQGDEVVCRCGRTFDSADAHRRHFDLQRARAALAQATTVLSPGARD